MSIAPFSFREFGTSEVEFVATAKPKPFLPTGRKKEEAAPPPPPPPPTFSEEEVQAAERDGYQKGFIDGIVEGKKQAENKQAVIDRSLSESVANFAEQYAPLFSIYRDILRQQAEQIPQIAHTIARKIAGDALAENAYALVETIAMRCVSAMVHEPKLVITINESMRQTLENKMQAAAKTLQMSSEINVVGDPNIAPPNFRIEWKNGAMVRDTDALWQQVEQVVASMVASSGHEADKQYEQLQAAAKPPAQNEAATDTTTDAATGVKTQDPE
ncbi:MAG: FliH/SctL family protein [Alphaproteobacteria bacterium]|nr:FliH/SctL family protein [Alphaproteobacteria bacterium]